MSAKSLWLSEVSVTSVTSQARHALMRQLDRLSPYRAHRWTEGQLCSDFKLGRAAVRTSLVELRTWQLVRPIPRQGYVIDPVSRAQWQDLSTVWHLAMSRCSSEHIRPVETSDEVDSLIAVYVDALRPAESPTGNVGVMTLPLLRRYLRVLPGALIQEFCTHWNTLEAMSKMTQTQELSQHCGLIIDAITATLSEQESAC